MDEFGVFILFAFIVGGGILFALGRWYPGSGAEQVDWKPTRSPELEAELELDDVDQMLEAQNARRRASRARRSSPRTTCTPAGGRGRALARRAPAAAAVRVLTGGPALARVLIVGCGCRGRALAESLVADGLAVRGTTRDPSPRAPAIEAAGAEGVVADPDRLGTLMAQLQGVTLVALAAGQRNRPRGGGSPRRPRLETFLERPGGHAGAGLRV